MPAARARHSQPATSRPNLLALTSLLALTAGSATALATTATTLAAQPGLSTAGDPALSSPSMSPTPQAPSVPKVSPGVSTTLGTMSRDQERSYWSANRRRETAERDLNRIRREHFQSIRAEVRQRGIQKLRDYTEPSLFPLLISVFKDEKADVRLAVLDHLASLKTDEADAMLTWLTLHDRDETMRAEAHARLKARHAAWPIELRAKGGLPDAVRSTLLVSFGSEDQDEIKLAGTLARDLKAYSIIPILIQAQMGQVGTAGGGGGLGAPTGKSLGMFKADDGSALAWILVGRQVSYVADLTPVTSANAVAFDPQIGVVTEGVILRIIDAVVLAYRVEIHNQLLGLASDLTGKSTANLGWDTGKWQTWWAEQGEPALSKLAAAQTAEEAQRAAKSAPAPSTTSPSSPSPSPKP